MANREIADDSMMDDDEINLLDYWRILVKRKVLMGHKIAEAIIENGQLKYIEKTLPAGRIKVHIIYDAIDLLIAVHLSLIAFLTQP